MVDPDGRIFCTLKEIYLPPAILSQALCSHELSYFLVPKGLLICTSCGRKTHAPGNWMYR